MVTRSLVWLLMEEHELWPVIAMLYLERQEHNRACLVVMGRSDVTTLRCLLQIGTMNEDDCWPRKGGRKAASSAVFREMLITLCKYSYEEMMKKSHLCKHKSF